MGQLCDLGGGPDPITAPRAAPPASLCLLPQSLCTGCFLCPEGTSLGSIPDLSSSSAFSERLFLTSAQGHSSSDKSSKPCACPSCHSSHFTWMQQTSISSTAPHLGGVLPVPLCTPHGQLRSRHERLTKPREGQVDMRRAQGMQSGRSRLSTGQTGQDRKAMR